MEFFKGSLKIEAIYAFEIPDPFLSVINIQSQVTHALFLILKI